MSYTPGPWEVGKRVSPGITFDHEINIFPPDTTATHGFQYGGPVCVVQANGEADDASLIAAAPDLLKALMECRNRLYVHQGKSVKELVARCDAAIAKATAPHTPPQVPRSNAAGVTEQGGK